MLDHRKPVMPVYVYLFFSGIHSVKFLQFLSMSYVLMFKFFIMTVIIWIDWFFFLNCCLPKGFGHHYNCDLEQQKLSDLLTEWRSHTAQTFCLCMCMGKNDCMLLTLKFSEWTGQQIKKALFCPLQWRWGTTSKPHPSYNYCWYCYGW